MARADAIDHAAQTAQEARHDGSSPQAQEHVDDMRDRHSVDVLNSDADPEGVNKVVDAVAMAEFEAEHGRAGEMREDAGLAYDSAQRREAMADSLDHIQNRAAVDARVRADIAQGRPPTDAVTNAPGRAPKARKTMSGPTTARTVQRPGHGR